MLGKFCIILELVCAGGINYGWPQRWTLAWIRTEMFREEYNVIHPDWRTPVFVTVSLSLLLKDSAASQVSMMHGTLSCWKTYSRWSMIKVRTVGILLLVCKYPTLISWGSFDFAFQNFLNSFMCYRWYFLDYFKFVRYNRVY